MLNFSTLKKSQTAIHFVGHPCIEQRSFHHATLRIAAVEHGHFLASQTIAFDQLTNLIDQPLRFCKIAGGLIHTHRLTRTLVGAQVFAQTIFIVANEGIGRIQNVAVASVVLL